MVDIDQDQQEGFAGEAAAPVAATASSPLVKFVQSFGGDKKNAAASGMPPVKAPVGKQSGAPRATVSMPAGPLVTIMTRNEFYRDGFRNLIRIAILEAIIIVGLLISFILFMSTGKAQDRYFATTADGRIMQLVPLDQTNMTTAALMSWVAQATSEVMTFGYSDYQRRLQQSSRHFTHHGWETFTAALQQSHIIDGMIAGKEVLTASPRNAPILMQEGVINGKYRWIVKLPLQVGYDSLTAARKDNLNVTIVIERVPSLENPSGVGIEQWISTQGQ